MVDDKLDEKDDTGRVNAWVDKAVIEKFRSHYPRQGAISKLIRFALVVAIEAKEEGLNDEHIGRKLKRALR